MHTVTLMVGCCSHSWRSLSLLQKTVCPQMWHPPLPRREGPGLTCLRRLGVWAVDRAAPACWIQLTVHTQHTHNITGVTITYVWMYIFLKHGYFHLVADLLQIWEIKKAFACSKHDSFLFCIDRTQRWSRLEGIQINEQSAHVHQESSSELSSFLCVVNDANYRYFVFFLLGPLILSLSCLSFKKGKRKGNINRNRGRGGMLKRSKSACFPTWSLSICFMFVLCHRFRLREPPLFVFLKILQSVSPQVPISFLNLSCCWFWSWLCASA